MSTDSQHRIERSTRSCVSAPPGWPRQAELPKTSSRRRGFSVWANALQNLADDTLLVVDIGAPQFRAAIEYAAQSRMADRLQRDGIDVTFVVPVIDRRIAQGGVSRASGRPAGVSRLHARPCPKRARRPFRGAARARGRHGGGADRKRVSRHPAAHAAPGAAPGLAAAENASIAPLVARDLDRETIGKLLDCSSDIAAMAHDMIGAWIEQIARSWRPRLPSWRGAGGEGLGRPAPPQRRAAAIAGAPCGRFCSGVRPTGPRTIGVGPGPPCAGRSPIRRGGFLLGPRPLAATLAPAMAQDRVCASIDGRLAAPAAPPLRRVPTGRCPIFAIAPSTELSAAVISIRIGTALLTVADLKLRSCRHRAVAMHGGR